MNGETKDQVYSGLATVGRISSTVRLVLVHLVFVPLLLVGLWLLLLRRGRLWASVPGVVTSNACRGPRDLSCSVEYTFVLPPPHGAQTRTERRANEGFPSRPGEVTTVWYDPFDPVGSAQLQNDDMRVFGGALALVAVIMIALAWTWWWLTRRYQAVAAAGAIYDIVR